MLGWDGPDRTPGEDDGQRDDAPARPTGETVDTERRPIRQQDHFGGEPRRAFPFPLSEQGQPDSGEHPRPGYAAPRQDELAGAYHVV